MTDTYDELEWLDASNIPNNPSNFVESLGLPGLNLVAEMLFQSVSTLCRSQADREAANIGVTSRTKFPLTFATFEKNFR